MTPEQQKALVRRYLDAVWNQGDLTIIDELITPTFDSMPLASRRDAMA
jgi:hypothetical protein